MSIKKGELRGEKVEYTDGVGCCVWYPFVTAEGKEIDSGVCFDFAADDIDDFIALLIALKEAEPEKFDGGGAA